VSSRFGKFIEICFDEKLMIAACSNTTYLLEKSRVVFMAPEERNYHVFYQLLSGASAELLEEMGLTEMASDPSRAAYLNQSGCIKIDDVDDAAEFAETNASFSSLGFQEADLKQLYCIVAGILHLGNITFEPV
jgi:myosin heavy subunit